MTSVVQGRASDRSPVPGGGASVRVLRRRSRIAAVLLTGLALLVLLGPRARFDGGWVEPALGDDVDVFLAGTEADVPGLPSGEAKSVLWVDPQTRARTSVALVYLHGFSADRHEVEPLVSDLARDLSANAYFTRLTGHGLGGDALGAASVADWLADAAEAVAVGARIGERVVLVGTSTGGTLAIWAAAQPEAAGRVAALVLVSPNLGLRDPAARILTWPWGGLIARAVTGPERCFEPESPAQAAHWTVCYPTRALLPMAALVRHVRSMELGGVATPALVIHSPSDQVVDSDAAARVLEGLGRSGAAFHIVDSSGDPADHVIAGSIMSPGTTDGIRRSIRAFLVDAGVAVVAADSGRVASQGR